MLSHSFLTVAVLAIADDHKTGFVAYLPLVGAILALTGAVGVAAWNQYQNRADRRRGLYSEAYKTVVGWAEMPYRVRRRDPDRPYEIVGMFHQLQEALDYHDGWMSTESPELARSFRHFVDEVKRKTGPAIKQAWEDDPCDPTNGFSPPDGQQEMPDIDEDKRRFVDDVRDHLSLSPERRLALKDRYPTMTRRSST